MMEAHLDFFKAGLKAMGALSEQDWQAVKSKAELRPLAAGQLLSGLGDGSYYFLFVCQGWLREVETGSFGEPMINRYLVPGSVFIGIDPASSVRLEAISAAEVLLLSERDVLKLEAERWAFRRLFRQFLIRYFKDMRLRGDILSARTAEMKYSLFYKSHKLIIEALPLSEQGRYLNLNKDTVCKLKAKHFPT